MKDGEKDFGKPRDDAGVKPMPTAYAGGNSNVAKEAAERKKGGRAKRKRGGRADGGVAAKAFGGVAGAPKANGGRAPRKSGGRTGSNFSPMSSAAAGSSPRGHKTTGSV